VKSGIEVRVPPMKKYSPLRPFCFTATLAPVTGALAESCTVPCTVVVGSLVTLTTTPSATPTFLSVSVLARRS
jgi:hypothetical protein